MKKDTADFLWWKRHGQPGQKFVLLMKNETITVLYTRNDWGIKAICPKLKIDAEAAEYDMARSFITFQIKELSTLPINHIPDREQDIPTK